MSLTPDLLHFIIIDLILSSLFWMIGHLIMTVFKKDSSGNVYITTFFKLLIGCITSVVCYALYKSCFVTTLSAAVILTICYIFYAHRNKQIDLSNWLFNLKQFNLNFISPFIFVAYLTIPFLAFSGLLVDTDGNMAFASNDYAHYAGIASLLSETGVETTSMYELAGYPRTPCFYHYFELWFAAFIHSIFGISAEYALILCTFPLLIAIAAYGALAYTSSKMKNVLVSASAAVIVFFIAPVNIQLKHLSISYDMVQALLLAKNVIVACGLFATLIHFASGHKVKACFTLSLISVVFLPTIPAVLCIWVSLLALSLRQRIKPIPFIILMAIVPIVAIPLFYIVFGKSGFILSDQTSLLFQLKDVYSDLSSYFHYAKYFMRVTIGIVLSYLLWLLLFLNPKCRLLARKHINTIVLLLIAAFLTMGGTAILFFMEDSGQLFFNFWQMVFSILAFVLVVEFLTSIKHSQVIIFAAIICLCFLAYKDLKTKSEKNDSLNSFYADVEMEIKNNKYSIAYMKDSADYCLYDAQFQLWSKSITYTIPYSEIRRFNDHYFPICLSIYEIPEPETPRDWLYYGATIQQSPFWLYVTENGLENNIDDAKVSFLASNKIQYLIANPDNEWFSKVSLPIDTIIKGEGIKDCLIRLKWE